MFIALPRKIKLNCPYCMGVKIIGGKISVTKIFPLKNIISFFISFFLAAKKKKKKNRWLQISSDFSPPISKIIASVKSTIRRVVFIIMKRFDFTFQSEGKGFRSQISSRQQDEMWRGPRGI